MRVPSEACTTLPIWYLKRSDLRKDPRGIPRQGFEERQINLEALDVTFCRRNLINRRCYVTVIKQRKLKAEGKRLKLPTTNFLKT